MSTFEIKTKDLGHPYQDRELIKSFDLEFEILDKVKSTNDDKTRTYYNLVVLVGGAIDTIATVEKTFKDVKVGEKVTLSSRGIEYEDKKTSEKKVFYQWINVGR